MSGSLEGNKLPNLRRRPVLNHSPVPPPMYYSHLATQPLPGNPELRVDAGRRRQDAIGGGVELRSRGMAEKGRRRANFKLTSVAVSRRSGDLMIKFSGDDPPGPTPRELTVAGKGFNSGAREHYRAPLQRVSR